MAETTLQLHDLIMTCGICGVAQKLFPKFHVAGRDTRELSDELIRRAIQEDPNGWTRIEYKAERFSIAVCAECVQYRMRRGVVAAAPLPVFSSFACACPKCGERNVSAIFCRGLTPSCSYGPGRDHMHRQCAACKFEWYEQSKDANGEAQQTGGSASAGIEREVIDALRRGQHTPIHFDPPGGWRSATTADGNTGMQRGVSTGGPDLAMD